MKKLLVILTIVAVLFLQAVSCKKETKVENQNTAVTQPTDSTSTDATATTTDSTSTTDSSATTTEKK